MKCPDFNKKSLETLYRKYNRRKFVHPDPLEFIYNYPNPEDWEVVGLIASSLAYGRVAQILKSVGIVLDAMGPSPREYLLNTQPRIVKKQLFDFKHRFTTGEDMAGMLAGIRKLIKKHGTVENCFMSHMTARDETVLPAMDGLVKDLTSGSGDTYLLPAPSRGSACKRLNLFLRWMIRDDAVDPGGWNKELISKMVIPLDTHMHRLSQEMGLTKRKSADLKTAVEITEAFRTVSRNDPVRYDFSLTRLGILKND